MNVDYQKLTEKFLDSLSIEQQQLLYELLMHDAAMDRCMDFCPCAYTMQRILMAKGYERMEFSDQEKPSEDLESFDFF